MNSARTAIVARGTSGQSDRAMPSTACATMATATSFSPCRRPSPRAVSPIAPAPEAKASINSADGRVKAIHAASAPGRPARIRPRPKPVWLEAGPGRNWESATSSA